MPGPRPKLKTRKYIAMAWSKITSKGATIDEIVAKVRDRLRQSGKGLFRVSPLNAVDGFNG